MSSPSSTDERPPRSCSHGLQAGSRRNPLAQALQEYGRLVKTNFVLDWLADQELRIRIGRQLNKGEQTPDQQSEQALCLAIVFNAIIVWNTVYTQVQRTSTRPHSPSKPAVSRHFPLVLK
jgi:TnpA family transposase